MIYGAIHQKNGLIKGYLRFNTGKIVKLSVRENIEFHLKLQEWNKLGHIKS